MQYLIILQIYISQLTIIYKNTNQQGKNITKTMLYAYKTGCFKSS